MLIANFVVPEI